MKPVLVLVALTACGRIGFESTGLDGGDGPVDADVPFVETVGVLDPAFGTGGQTIVVRGAEQGYMFDIRARPGGYFTYGRGQNGATFRGQLLAWTRNGNLDPAFSSDGVAEYSIENRDYGYGLLPLADGRWFLIGDGFRVTSNADDMFFGMIGSDGVVDTAFGAGVGLEYLDIAGFDTVFRAVETARGIVACGVTDRSVPDTHHVLVGLRLDGVRDTGFGVGGLVTDDDVGLDDSCNDVVTDDAGRIVTVGSSGTRQIVTRYDSLGARDLTFATAGRQVAATAGGAGLAIAIAPDGDIVVVGGEQKAGFAMRLAPDGTPRATFGQNGIATYRLGLAAGDEVVFEDVLVQPNGKIVAVGYRQTGGALQIDGVVVRMLGDGSLDPSFGTGGMIVLDVGPGDTLNAVHAESGGLIAVGNTTTASITHAWIVRLR